MNDQKIFFKKVCLKFGEVIPIVLPSVIELKKMRQAGFYWVIHKARTKFEVGEWNMPIEYWTMPDSRHHFGDGDFTYIHSSPINLPSGYVEEKIAEESYADWQSRELNNYAFPGQMMGIIGNTEQLIPFQGLTKRQYFAIMAMQGLLSGVNCFPELSRNLQEESRQISKFSLALADELLKSTIL